ncbi:MAG: type II secretion system F family protein [Vicinamibacterales bacterium]
MSANLLITLAVVFLAAGFLTWAFITMVMSRSASAGRRRLDELVQPRMTVLVDAPTLAPVDVAFWERIRDALPTSRGTVKRQRRDLELAGFTSARTAALMSISELVLPILFALPPLFLLAGFQRWGGVGLGAICGYMAPGFLLSRRLNKRKKQIQNGLADALDLLVLCLEAGSSLDQAIVKAGDELQVAYPALADQLRILISEMRAGKARLEAFRGLAARTQIDDVRALVSMLVQTDRFGTSISQALRSHSEVVRTKRRQRAEEKAQKVSVKLVFPLVFCLFPALYVVLLGPALIQFGRVLGSK